MTSLEGRVALITGAKGGLGTYVTNSFLRAGAAVAGVSRSISQTDFKHPNFTPVPAELSSGDAASGAVAAVIEKLGRVDVLVHLVGAYNGGKDVVATTDEDFDKMFQLNLRSAFHMIRAVLPQMRSQSAGRILAIGSRAGVEPVPAAAAYSAAKAALLSLVRSVALENAGSGISSNVVLPGTMDTPANRAAMPNANFSKWVQPCQVAELLVYLASDGASNINGAAVPIYGVEP